jgi:FkbM family methyltransferase
MNRQQLKESFRKGDIKKHDFIDAMYLQHEALFDYMKILHGTDIASIEIKSDEVVFISKKDEIKISCTKPDKRTAPFEIMNFDEYESGDADLLFRFIKNGDIIFDIGANIGWYSLSFAKRFPDSTIYSFEPLEKTYLDLEKNVRLNNLANIHINNFGFSDKNEFVTFYTSSHTSVSNSSENISGEDQPMLTTCEVKRLDDVLKLSQTSLDFIKCDVEGAELFVFKGAVETIKRCKPIIFTEMLRKWSEKFGYSPNDIISLFDEIGYNCFFANGDKLEKIKFVTTETTATNFIFFHLEKHADLIRENEN